MYSLNNLRMAKYYHLLETNLLSPRTNDLSSSEAKQSILDSVKILTRYRPYFKHNLPISEGIFFMLTELRDSLLKKDYSDAYGIVWNLMHGIPERGGSLCEELIFTITTCMEEKNVFFLRNAAITYQGDNQTRIIRHIAYLSVLLILWTLATL